MRIGVWKCYKLGDHVRYTECPECPLNHPLPSSGCQVPAGDQACGLWGVWRHEHQQQNQQWWETQHWRAEVDIKGRCHYFPFWSHQPDLSPATHAGCSSPFNHWKSYPSSLGPSSIDYFCPWSSIPPLISDFLVCWLVFNLLCAPVSPETEHLPSLTLGLATATLGKVGDGNCRVWGSLTHPMLPVSYATHCFQKMLWLTV